MNMPLVPALFLMSILLPPPLIAQEVSEKRGPSLLQFNNSPVQSTLLERSGALQNPGLLTAYNAKININALLNLAAENGRSRVLKHPASGQVISLRLPETGKPLTMHTLTTTEDADGVRSWYGEIEGDPDSQFFLNEKNGNLFAKIQYQGLTYIIEPVDKNRHLLYILDPALMPPDEQEEPSADNKNAIAEESDSKEEYSLRDMPIFNKASGNCRVRALFIYTQGTYFSQYAAELASSQIVQEFNLSLSRSNVNNQCRLVKADTIASSYIRGNNSRLQVRQHFTSEYYPGTENTRQKRIDNYADIVFITIPDNNQNDGGIAYNSFSCYPSQTNSCAFYGSQYPYAFSTKNFLLSDKTALHEIGHVLGGQHEDQASNPDISDSVGMADSQCQWQTLMGGYVQCPYNYNLTPGNQPTERIGYWSNPSLSYNNQPIGVLGVRNMSRWLGATGMPVVANLMPDPPPPPAPPSNFVAIDNNCNGLYTLMWNSVSNATRYEVYRSSNYYMSNSALVYDGVSTTTSTIVPSGSWYYAVKACNAGGCSAYSNKKLLTRTNTCL